MDYSTTNQNKYNFCPHCGCDLSSMPTVSFCPNCGKPLSASNHSPKPAKPAKRKSKIWIVWLVLGILFVVTDISCRFYGIVLPSTIYNHETNTTSTNWKKGTLICGGMLGGIVVGIVYLNNIEKGGGNQDNWENQSESNEDGTTIKALSGNELENTDPSELGTIIGEDEELDDTNTYAPIVW